MSRLPTYKLTLHKTYYDHGFFNLGVEVDRFVRPNSGPVSILLGPAQAEISATINREANVNGTPRVMGGAALRNWFQRNYEQGEVVDVVVVSKCAIWVK